MVSPSSSSPDSRSLRAWLAAALVVAFAVASSFPLNFVSVPVDTHSFGPWARKLGTAGGVYVLEGLLCCAVLGRGAVREALGSLPGRRAMLGALLVALLWFAFTLWASGRRPPNTMHPVASTAMALVVLLFVEGWLTFGVLWASLSRIVSSQYVVALFAVAMIAMSLGNTALESMQDLPGETDWLAGIPAALLFGLLFGFLRQRSGGPTAPTVALIVSYAGRVAL